MAGLHEADALTEPPPIPVGVSPPIVATPVPLIEGPVAAIPPTLDGLLLYDSSRSTYRELWRDVRSPINVAFAWLSKLLRMRLPGTGNDPNVQSLSPFAVPRDRVPADVQALIDPLERELKDAQFEFAGALAVVDLVHTSRLFVSTWRHTTGTSVGRVHLRMEGSGNPPRTHLHCDIISERADGRFLWTTSARSLLNAPPTCDVVWRESASPTALWQAHQADPGFAAGALRPALDDTDALAMTERHHAVVRDFHLKRGVFRVLTEQQRNAARALNDSVHATTIAGAKYPEVLAELHKIQFKAGSWVRALMMLAVSAALFIIAGAGLVRWDWRFLALLVPILFFHELGHYVAMKVFGYRNLRMFFIPLFGAAVTGENYSAPGWKKIVVSLMGPLPGILLGLLLVVLYGFSPSPLLLEACSLTLILNAMNLLPVFPLDGGRVVQILLFARHPMLDASFRLIACGVLIFVGIWLPDRILMFLGIFMLIGVPLAFRMARIARSLRREGFIATFPDGAPIPPTIVEPIVDRLTANLPARPNNQILARQVLQIVETLNASPPGVAASLAWGTLHAGSFAIAVLALVLLFGLHRDGIRERLDRSTANARVDPSAIVESPAGSSAVYGPDALTLVATWKLSQHARDAFPRVEQTIPAGAHAVLLDNVILIGSHSGDRGGLDRIAAQLESDGAKTFSNTDGASIHMHVSGTAPSAEQAAAISALAKPYLVADRRMLLIPPWYPNDTRTDAARAESNRARRLYAELWQLRRDAESDAFLEMREREPSQTRPTTRQKVTSPQIPEVKLAELRSTFNQPQDPILIDTMLKLWEQQDASQADVPERLLLLGIPLGQLQLHDGLPVAGSLAYSASAGGFVHQTGERISLNLELTTPVRGLPAVLRWLGSQQCSDLRVKIAHLPPGRWD